MKTNLTRILLTMMAAILAAPSMAIERVNTVQTDCAAIQAIIQRDGEAILRYPSKRIENYTLYERYVSGDRFCKRDERAISAPVPSKDRASCRVYLCEPYEPLFEYMD